MEKRAIVRLGIGRVYHHTKQWQQPVSYGSSVPTVAHIKLSTVEQEATVVSFLYF